MSRGIRQMNLAAMADEDLTLLRNGVARALDGDQDYERLMEDIDAEIELRTREPLL